MYFSTSKQQKFDRLSQFKPEANVIHKFQPSLNSLLWLDDTNQVTSFNQLECFISAQHSYAMLKFVYDIDCATLFSLTTTKQKEGIALSWVRRRFGRPFWSKKVSCYWLYVHYWKWPRTNPIFQHNFKLHCSDWLLKIFNQSECLKSA